MTKKYYRVQLREMKSENDRERLSERGREIEKEREREKERKRKRGREIEREREKLVYQCVVYIELKDKRYKVSLPLKQIHYFWTID